MSELQEKIMTIVNANQPRCSWQQLMSGLTYPEQQGALKQVTALSRNNVLSRQVTRNPDTGRANIEMWAVE